MYAITCLISFARKPLKFWIILPIGEPPLSAQLGSFLAPSSHLEAGFPQSSWAGDHSPVGGEEKVSEGCLCHSPSDNRQFSSSYKISLS